MFTFEWNLYKDSLDYTDSHKFIVRKKVVPGYDHIWIAKKLFWKIYVKDGKGFRDFHGNFTRVR